jgi:hypothetical protein
MKVKQKTKYYLVLGIVIVAMFGIMIVPSVAAMLQKQITVSTGVNIYVDDKKLNPVDANGNPVEVFIYNGTTYLPVRAIADAVGKPVMWDGATKSVYLGRHDTDKPAVMLHKLDYFDSGGALPQPLQVFLRMNRPLSFALLYVRLQAYHWLFHQKRSYNCFRWFDPSVYHAL